MDYRVAPNSEIVKLTEYWRPKVGCSCSRGLHYNLESLVNTKNRYMKAKRPNISMQTLWNHIYS